MEVAFIMAFIILSSTRESNIVHPRQKYLLLRDGEISSRLNEFNELIVFRIFYSDLAK